MSEQKRQMTVDFSGLLTLLGDRLYSDKRVFVRELVQNASDSIVKKYGSSGAGQGRIDVEVVPSERRITFRDNGIGMDDAAIESDLSRIASSGTRKERERTKEDNLIGEHGIGFLSAFVIAERVCVRTHMEGSKESWLWENENKLDYTLKKIPQDGLAGSGTTVDVFVSREHTKSFVSDSAVREILQQYCDMLRTPIYLNGSRNPINTQVMPWERDTADERTREFETRAYLERTFPDSVLETIYFDFRDGVRANGVLYITTTRSFQIDPPRHVRLCQSRMLLTERADELLPKWATFINGIVDSPDIRSNAARDDFVRDATAEELTERLGARIVEYLTALHAEKPERFKEIVQYHNLGLMAACWYQNDFFDRFYDLLLWRVNRKPFDAQVESDTFGEEEKGTWRTIGEILDRLAPTSQAEVTVPTIDDGVAVAQYFEMADAANAVIVDTSRYFAADILRKIEGLQDTTRIGGRRIRIVSITEDDANRLFRPLLGAEDNLVRELVAYFDGKVSLAGASLRMEAAHTKPESVVGVIRSSADVAADIADAMRAAADTRLPEYARNTARQLIRAKRRESIRLVLNAENPLVRKLAEALGSALSSDTEFASRRDEFFLRMAPALYNIAILNSQTLLSQSGQSRVGGQFAEIIEQLLDVIEEARTLREELTRKDEALTRLSPVESQKNRDFVSVFYMTPFAERLAPVRQSVIRAIGRLGARCTLATDSVHRELLIENLHEHIRSADAFVADVTGLNANVMLELGAVKFENQRRRPVLLICSGMSADDLPADLKGQLYIDYGTRQGPDLEKFLVQEFGKFEPLKAILGDPTKAKVVTPDRVRTFIDKTGLNPDRFDVASLVEAFPTDRNWKNASEAELSTLLADDMRKWAGTVLNAIRTGLKV